MLGIRDFYQNISFRSTRNITPGTPKTPATRQFMKFIPREKSRNPLKKLKRSKIKKPIKALIISLKISRMGIARSFIRSVQKKTVTASKIIVDIIIMLNLSVFVMFY